MSAALPLNGLMTLGISLTALSLTILISKREVPISTLQRPQGERDSACTFLARGLAQHCWGWCYTLCEGKVSSFVPITLCPLGGWVSQRFQRSPKTSSGKWAFLEEALGINEDAGSLAFPSISSCAGAGCAGVQDSGSDTWQNGRNRCRVCVMAETRDQICNVWASCLHIGLHPLFKAFIHSFFHSFIPLPTHIYIG